MGFDYIEKAPLLSSLVASCFGCRVSFFGMVESFLSVRCDFDVFMTRGELRSFYFTILSFFHDLSLIFIELFTVETE